MKGYDYNFLETLKSKNDIVEVISRYVKLEQRRGTYWGCCPFHHEKTASFCVNPTDRFYYCYGCHKSGDVITFIREMESLDFNDAVKYLADRAQIPLPEVKYDDDKIKEQKHKRERLLALLKDTALFYVKNYRSPQGAKHYEYALKRKFTEETTTKFGIGASLDFNGLPTYLKSKGYTEEEMVESGACGEKNGRVFDWLGGRLIIPMIDQFGNVIAFDGRRIDGEKDRKYVNTKETSIFFKGKTLFNINNLKKLKNEGLLSSIILVEGHLDVVSLSQGGFPNVVASMGTAFTKDQARMLKRFADTIYVCYDSDTAGKNATIKSLEILSAEALDVKVVSMPEGMDPDDVITKLGKSEYERLLVESKPLIDFKLDLVKSVYNPTAPDTKRKYVSAAIKVIRESASPAEQEDLLKVVRDQTGITFEALKRELYSESAQVTEIKTEPVPEFNKETGDKNDIASRFILYSYLFNKPYVQETDLSSLEFINPAHKEIVDYILECKEQGKAVRFSDLYEAFSEMETELSLIAGMDSDEKRDEIKKFNKEEYFEDCIRVLKTAFISKKIEMLTAKFKEEKDTEQRRQIATELNQLLIQKNRLN